VPQSAAISLGPSPLHHQPKIAREWGRGGEFAMVAVNLSPEISTAGYIRFTDIRIIRKSESEEEVTTGG